MSGAKAINMEQNHPHFLMNATIWIGSGIFTWVTGLFIKGFINMSILQNGAFIMSMLSSAVGIFFALWNNRKKKDKK